jgi:spore maturation protein CgeB
MMTPGLSIAFFGSSLDSAYWNSATHYRGVLRALAARGHSITFYEPDAYGRQQHRDWVDPAWAQSVRYSPELSAAQRVIKDARTADVIIKASGAGMLDDYLDAAIADLRDLSRLVVFWDVDAPATLERLLTRPLEPLLQVIPLFDVVLTYAGGAAVVDAYTALGARSCVPIDSALDPEMHCPAPPDPRFEADLIFIGNRRPEREDRIDEFFFGPAERLPHLRFVLAGSGWHDRVMPDNVRYVGHVYTRDHNAANASPRAVLSLNRESTVRYAFAPPTRVFEAAGAGACVITDSRRGIEQFLTPGKEVLVASDGDDVASVLQALTLPRSREIGRAARRRLLSEHTYEHRAAEVEAILLAAQPYPAYGVIPSTSLPAFGAESPASVRPYFTY